MITKKTVLFLLLCLTRVSLANNWAHNLPLADSPLQKLAAEFEASCLNNVCQPPYLKKTAVGLGAALKLKFYAIGKSQAQVWGDTILEGDYFAEGDTRLDEVTLLYKNAEPVGYLITYSETAWDTSDCRYDENDPSSLYTCRPGRIVESSYVSPDMKEYFYDDQTEATFKDDN